MLRVFAPGLPHGKALLADRRDLAGGGESGEQRRVEPLPVALMKGKPPRRQKLDVASEKR
jgi:hypothetical protein